MAIMTIEIEVEYKPLDEERLELLSVVVPGMAIPHYNVRVDGENVSFTFGDYHE